jgi:SAM-dependent methyltransferase
MSTSIRSAGNFNGFSAEVRFQDEILERYLAEAPVPLALERVLECRIHRKHEFRRPVLDVGCGDGILARILFADRLDTGIDPDERELASARRHDAYDELIACRGDAIPKPSGFYRTVLSNSVLEHIPEIEPVLREINRVLAPDGHAYFTVPSDRFDSYSVVNQILSKGGLNSTAARYRRFFNSFWNHYHYYSPSGWRALVERCGFEVVECYAFNPQRVCVMNDSLVPFSLGAFATKKAINRWVLFPSVRRVLAGKLKGPLERFLESGERANEGGLVYLNLKKGQPR